MAYGLWLMAYGLWIMDYGKNNFSRQRNSSRLGSAYATFNKVWHCFVIYLRSFGATFMPIKYL
jgi:hypothetical protein